MNALLRLISGDAVSKALAAATNIFLIRAMPPAQYAVFASMFALALFAYQAACGVVERLYIAEHSRFSGRERTILNVLLMAAGVLITLFYGTRGEWGLAALTFVVSYSLGSFQLARIRLQKQERYTAFVVMEASRNLITMVIVAGILFFGGLGNYTGMVAMTAVGLSALVVDLFARRWVSASPRSSESYPQTIAAVFKRQALVYYSLIGALVPYMPILLADALANEHAVATYGVAQRYQAILSMLVVATNVYMLPRLANEASMTGAVSAVRSFYRHTGKILASIVAYVGLVWAAMPWMNGPGHDDARGAFLILSLCSVLSLLSSPLVNLLLRQESYRFMLASMVAGVVSMLAVCLGTIPIFGDWSFGLGSLAGYAVISGLFAVGGLQVIKIAHPAR